MVSQAFLEFHVWMLTIQGATSPPPLHAYLEPKIDFFGHVLVMDLGDERPMSLVVSGVS